MSSNIELEARRSAALARGVGVQTKNFAVSAENATVIDADGNQLIDFAAGIAVVNTGHRHPKVIEAVKAQLDAFTHTCHQVLPYEPYVRLAERLNDKVPGDFDKKSIFVTTGAESVENAVKIARAYTGRNAVIAFGGGFHGRTFMTMSLTGKVAPYKAGFGSMMPDVFHVPFPNALHGVSTDDSFAAMESLFKTDLDPARLAAVIFEPVQGEGGFVPAPRDFVLRLREFCDQHGIVMIADEVQSGFARTGTLFAMEGYGVAADITTMAKGLGGGLPIAAVTGRADIMDAANPGGLGGTYGGNPLGCAVGAKVMEIVSDPAFLDQVNAKAGFLRQKLEGLVASHPDTFESVRGVGLMLGLKCKRAPTDLVAAAYDQNLLTVPAADNVLRLLPALNISEADLSEAVKRLDAAATQLES
jgi:4-aminobutyrate aminotransferase